jgi:gliding motility-associated-like protein
MAQSRFLKKTKDIFGCRVFIENKGQFDKLAKTDEKILFAYENSYEHIYFTAKGPVYKLVKHYPITEREMERAEKGKEMHHRPNEDHYVKVNWLNSNDHIVVVESEKQSHYFTYGGPEFNSSTFKKITYKNVYPNIDVEYSFPEEHQHGIKYSFILHPGADPSQIKISYNGEVRKVAKKNTEIIVKTSLEDIVEHTPLTFYEGGSPLQCIAQENENIISYIFPGGYDQTKEVIIDPWVTTITSLDLGNYGYDVDHDGVGNLFVYGGLEQIKVAKYDQVGALQWTFSGIVGGISWTSQGPNNQYIGNFVVNKKTGKCYVGQGYVIQNDTRIVRIDQLGNYDNWVTPPLWTVEVWDMQYHCPTNTVYEIGGSTIQNLSAGIVNEMAATVQVANFTGIPTSGQDVLSSCVDDAGNLFIIFASQGTPLVTNKILRVNNTFNGNVFMVPSGFMSFAEAGNKASYQGGMFQSNGYNCLAVSANYLYYYDGYNIAAYNKTTGAQVGTTTIPMLAIGQQGGIAVDECENIYVGGIDNLFSYNFNGANFNPLPMVNLGVPSQNKYVYDIKLDRGTQLLYICGSGFVGTWAASNSTNCGGGGVVVNVNCGGLNNGNALATLTTAIANPTISYIWTNSGGTVSTTFSTNATTNSIPVTNGVYTLQTIVNAPCGPVFVNTINVQCCPTVAITSTVTQAGCSYSVNSATLTVVGATVVPTPTWTPPPGIVGPGLTASGLVPGLTTVSLNFGFNCSAIKTVSALANAPPVSFTVNYLTANTDITCNDPFVSLQAVSNYTFGTLSYSWTSISFTAGTPSVGITSQNILTVTVSDPLTGCFQTQTISVLSNTTAPTISVNPVNQVISCNTGAPATFTGSVLNPSINIKTDWYSPLNPLPGGVPIATSNNTIALLSGFIPPGIYTMQTTNLVTGCKTQTTVTIASLDAWPTFSIGSTTGFSVGCNPLNCTTLSIINPISTQTPPATCSYTFLAPSFTGVVTPSIVLGTNPSTVLCTPGTYTVIVQDNSSFCRTSLSVPILQNTVAPNVSASVTPFTYTLTCRNPTLLGVGSSTTPNTTISWNVPSVPPLLASSTLVIGDPANGPNTGTTSLTYANFTVVAYNTLNACETRSVLVISQNFKAPISSPTISIATPTAIYCTVANAPVVLTTGNSTTTSGGGPLAFVANPCWAGPSPQTPTCGASSYSCYVPGIYTLAVEDNYNGCTSSGTVNVIDKTQPPVLNSPIENVILPCGASSATLIAKINGAANDLRYWYYQYPDGAAFSPTNAPTVVGGNPFANGTSAQTVFVDPDGRYYYKVTNTLTGCQAIGVFVVSDGSLNSDFLPDVQNGVAPLQVVFTPTNYSGLTNVGNVWNFGNGTSATFSNEVSVTALYRSPGTYTAVLMTSKGPCRDTVSKIIHVEAPSKLEVPNIFTPNGDGANDVFFLHTQSVSEISILIFDRWGNKVYEVNSSTGNIAWDGSNFKGKECAAGVYYFILKAEGEDRKAYTTKGNITLLR